MIASLPMYDRPETRAAYDRLWQAMRHALGHGPRHLSRDGDIWDIWQSPDLLFGQTCSLPYRTALHEKVDIVASPVHDLPAPPGHYFSVLVVGRNDPRNTVADFNGAPVAVNAKSSQSGWAALLDALTPGPVETTGSHLASVQAVANARAEIAAIDAVTWAMSSKWDAVSGQVRVVAQTPPSPALPFVTAKGHNTEALFSALEAAVATLSQSDRATLCLRGVTKLPRHAYLSIPVPDTV